MEIVPAQEEKPKEAEWPLERAEVAVQQLYDFRDHYFEHNSTEKASLKNQETEEKLKETLNILDYVQASSEETAQCLFLRGKAQNVLPNYNPMAKDALAKAVKMNPKLVEAWNCLGECYWKNGEVEAARNCFMGALNHAKTKESLRNLSMVLRQIGKEPSEKVVNIKESVERAKEAVQCDVKDGTSWYILGNAYLSLFFCGSQSPQLIKQCMTAYAQAYKDPVASNNPDLHFNRAMAYKFQEEYKLALSDFKQAQSLDPGWSDPTDEKNKLLSLLTKTLALVEGKGKLKPKRLNAMVKSLGPSDLGPYSGGSYSSQCGQTIQLDHVPFAKLQTGVNPNKVTVGKVVGFVPVDDPVPYIFAMIDRDNHCWPVTVYNMAVGAGFAVGDSVAIPEPFCQETDFVEDGQTFKFFSIRVDNPIVLVVNKKKLGSNRLAPSTLAVTAKSE